MKAFAGISLPASLAMVFAIGSASAQTDEKELKPSEKWVAAQVTAGKIADLSKQFPDEIGRKLSAHFLEDLLTAALPGVKLHRNGVQIIGAIIDEPIVLKNAHISCEVGLQNCQFRSSVAFVRANLAGTVSFDESTFKAKADFSTMKVGSDASFQKAIFEEAVNFDGANIGVNFVADEAEFKNKRAEISFSGMTVGNRASFEGTVFEGPTNFEAADIGSNFEADEAQFKNKTAAITFREMTVRRIARFTGAVFEGPLDFDGVDIGLALVANDAKFQNENPGSDFYSMKVGNTAYFTAAIFDGPVNFRAADIGSCFEASGAHFRSKKEVWFPVKWGGVGLFERATFAGPVSFADSSFLDLMIGDLKGSATPVPRLDLSRGSIKRQLRIQKISIQDFVAESLHVEGPADLTEITVEHSADLRYGDFSTLDLSRSIWPRDAQAFQMQGMNYKYVERAQSEPESHEALLKLVGQSAYSADVYGNLEAFFLRRGYRGDADRVFIEGKRRERKENLHGLPSLGSWLLDWLVGYGRCPWQAGIPCAFFVALGCFLFSPKRMEPQKLDDAPRVYNRFWYSLGLFLPFVDLQADRVWKPKPHQTFLRNYVRVHALLGWILIPIVLAALTGLIK